jgi:hypothetical protein
VGAGPHGFRYGGVLMNLASWVAVIAAVFIGAAGVLYALYRSGWFSGRQK